MGGGIGPKRPPQERSELLDGIVAGGGWITEGVHLEWTERLFEEADLIVWLDHVTWSRASRGIILRFVRDATAAVRQRKSAGELLRFRDYARQLVGLGKAIMESRAYYGTPPSRAEKVGDYVRASTAAQVTRYPHKLVHCRSLDDVDAFVASLAVQTDGACADHPDEAGQR